MKKTFAFALFLGCASAPSSSTPVRASCAQVTIGLDLRALPTNSSQTEIDLFVGSAADGVRKSAPSGSNLRFATTPGVGTLHAFFDGPDALSRCEATVGRYLPIAPRLPIINASAATIDEPCRACAP